MDSPGVAALAWIPFPGASFLAARSRPLDRLVRFHARQAGLVVVTLYAVLLALGLAANAWPGVAGGLTPVAGAALAALLLAALVGGVAAARGRYLRIRPAWDLLTRRHP